MANLPPKPESPLKEERRHDRVTTARPMAPLHSPRVADSDRSYVPRHQRSEADSYVAVYASRRPPARDWERDRRDRDYDRHRDSRRDWRDSDRRDPRPYDRRRDDSDRFRPRRYDSAYHRSRSPRRYSRSRSPFRRRSRSPPPPPRRFSRSRSPRVSRSHTRSPRHRPYSPPRTRPRVYSRSRSPRPRSPPPKRIKLGNHSISDSPRPSRAHSRSPPRSPSRTRSEHINDSHKTPPPTSKETKLPPAPTPPVASQPPSPKKVDIDTTPPSVHPTTTTSHVDEKPAVKTEKSDTHAQPTQPALNHPTKPEVPVKVEPIKEPVPHLKPEVVEKPSSSFTPKPDKLEARGRSHSPPKGPRGSQWRKISKSPPKGPRNHNPSTPSMMPVPVPPPAPIPAPAHMYPTGPRADRRPKDLSDQPMLRSTEFTKIQPPTSDRWTRNVIHPKAGRYGTTQLELDLVRYRSHHINLNQVHDQVSRTTRRALHELDMATIDLRMAETRRRIADAQVEKAKLGMLGIDCPTPDIASSD